MSPVARLAAFAVVLVLVFGAGAALGSAVGPYDAEPEPPVHQDHTP